jgi:hypothetical protein
MKKKQPPEQYAAKLKAPGVHGSSRPVAHPSYAVAKALIGWMDKGGVPPSIVLLHGLHFARSREYDGNPVDTYQPQLKMQGDDNKVIAAMLDTLSRPQTDKVQLVATWLKSVWVNKSARPTRAVSPRESARNPAKAMRTDRQAGNKNTVAKKKPVVVVKKKH